MTTLETAAAWLKRIGDGAVALAPLVGAGTPAELIVLGAGEALGLAADLCTLGMHPVTAIKRIRSCAGDFDAVTAELMNQARGE